MKNVICCTYKIRFENFYQVISDGKKRYFEENIATMTFLTPARERERECVCVCVRSASMYAKLSLSACLKYPPPLPISVAPWYECGQQVCMQSFPYHPAYIPLPCPSQ